MRKDTTVSGLFFCALILGFFLLSCKGKDPSAENESAISTAAPAKAMLPATDLIELGTYPDAAAVQTFMKDKQAIFLYPRKGEYVSLAQSAVADTAGQLIALPLATLYYASEPQATWRVAQTVHTDSLKNILLKEFMEQGYTLQDSINNYYATEAKAYLYRSEQYPGRVLYYSPTTTPWFKKGIYLGASWRSHCFEINIIHE